MIQCHAVCFMLVIPVNSSTTILTANDEAAENLSGEVRRTMGLQYDTAEHSLISILQFFFLFLMGKTYSTTDHAQKSNKYAMTRN